MFIGITNTPRDYAWGSTTAIGELLGRPVSGGPEAELWLGAHGASPSVVTAATPALAGSSLDAVLAAEPALLGGGRSRLPFLMKVLAAAGPLSLQVHPDLEQARAGFAREEAAGVPLTDPARNYADDNHKPELILALSPTFEALAGFRHLSEARMLLAELQLSASRDDRRPIAALAERLAAGDPAVASSTGSSGEVIRDGMPASADTTAAHRGGGNPLADAVAWLLHGGDEVDGTVVAVTAAAARTPQASSFAREFATVGLLAHDYPGDPGIVLSLLLNRISLAQGQALALSAGVVHAYLDGLGIEVMAASDNVLRGGLTPKHVDVDELLQVVRFEQSSPPIVRPEATADGVQRFRASADDFVLDRVDVGAAGAVHGERLAGPDEVRIELTGPAVALCLSGGLTVSGAKGSFSLARGDAVYVSPDEQHLVLSGSADVMVATTP
ncbi:mannose-6-phosphate isomerase, class I [uncultured Amnibacterium sp.]|uniref:mannose-6-phosphate isomerase, class I n=1 Tax=uncultured Amnibacterium sp. TaxID=1631851 RepID=UPI0035CA4B71